MARTHVVLSDEVIAGINNEWVRAQRQTEEAV